MRNVYFPNLNGVRFLAAFGVIIHHVEQYKYVLKEPNHWDLPFFDQVGKLCVILFFVLSGFLITYLLLREREVTGGIAVGPFYVRRMLRIWPLYYLLAGLGLFVFPHLTVFYLPGFTEAVHNDFAKKVLLMAVILPNLVTVPIPGIYQLWSIGVEEQFYLLWPVLMKKITHPLVACLLVIAGYFAVKFALLPLVGEAMHHSQSFRMIAQVWHKFSIDCMAIGGIAAWLLHRGDEPFRRLVFSPITQVATYLLVAGLIAYGVVIPYVNFEVYGVLFAVLLVNLAANPKSLVSLENRLFHYLGKISYGLYMYHLVAIALAHAALRRLDYASLGDNLLLHGLSVLLTVGLAALSYRFFESRFIRWKKGFTKVASGRETLEAPVAQPEIAPASAR
jgi:peptidoglycan/LPS O-acetylase OafA/YrhL